MPIIRDLENHPVMEGIDEILLPSGCTLEVETKARALAKTGGTADPPSRPVIAVAEYGKGRVICIGSYEIFRRGGGFKKEGNKNFALNAFTWLNRMRSAPLRAEDRTSDDSARASKKESGSGVVSEEFENTLRRLVNAVFDLQKDIETATKKVERVESNIDALRNQFQDFAEKTQDQLGVIIPAKQFKTKDENKATDLEADIKSLNAELKSVKQLQNHIEERHSSGAMPKEAYEEQSGKLAERMKSLEKKISKKKKELKDLAK
jgi:prophage DNA circulation protein